MAGKEPLVSILIPNYNHAKYLDQCIQSALKQTYENLEIILLDNTSADDSIEVAGKYLYDKRFRICRNPINVMNHSYRILAEDLSTGKYLILLCADDYLYPDFIKMAVDIMERNPNVGYVHGEKDHVLSDGTIIEGEAFYRCSFVASGENAMPIYMMAPVAVPTQGVIRRSAFLEIHGYDKEIDHLNADRTMWFYLSACSDAGYIKERCCAIRTGDMNETAITTANFQHPILLYLTILNYLKYAKEKGYKQVLDREEAAKLRLAKELVDTAKRLAIGKQYGLAEKYLTLAKVITRKVQEEESFKEAEDFIVSGDNSGNKNSDSEVVAWSKRKREYDPPVGYHELIRGIDYGV